MLGYVENLNSSRIFLKKFNILFHSEERPAKTKCVTAKLRAALVGAESDPAQC